jgi:hypothetical protein
MGDLEEVHARQATGDELGVDRLLDVAHQQEPTLRDDALEHHGHVVDPRAAVGWIERDATARWPEHPHRDLVDDQAIASRDRAPDRSRAVGQFAQPRRIARSWAAHAGLEHAVHAVSREEQRQPGHMVLVGVRQDHRFDLPIPRRDASVEGDQQAIRVRPAVDQQPTAP